MKFKISYLYSMICFVLLIVISSCSKNSEPELLTIKIPNKSDANLFLSDMAESIKRVQLETNENILLGNPKDIKIHNERIYVVETAKISIFNLDGNFLQILGRRGEGPGEYTNVYALDIDEKSGLIYVSAYNKLLVYNLDLEFVEELKTSFPIEYLKIYNKNLFIVSEKVGVKVENGYANQTNLYKMNSLLEILDSIPVRTVLLQGREVGGFGFKYYLSNIEDDLFLFKPVLTTENILRDTLYQVRDKGLFPAIKFDFERPQSLNESGRQTLLLYNIINSSSYLICEYDQDWERMLFLYYKKNAIGYNLSKGLIDEEGDPVFLRPLDLANDIFYYIKEVEFIDKSTEEENPIIGIVKLK
jgi:hypothetical protein